MDPSKLLGSGPGLTIRQPLAMYLLSIMRSNFYFPVVQIFKSCDVGSFWGKFVESKVSSPLSLPFVQGATMDLCVSEYCICSLGKFVFLGASSFLPASVAHLRVYWPLSEISTEELESQWRDVKWLLGAP